MAGIGDYIHWHAKRYLEYGIGETQPRGPSAAKSIINAHQELSQLYKGKVKQANWKAYENFLNDALYPQEVPRYSEEVSNNQINNLYKMLDDRINSQWNRINTDSHALLTEVTRTNKNIAHAKQYSGSYRKNKTSSTRVYNTEVQWRSIKKLLTSLTNIRKSLVVDCRDGKITEKELENYYKKINELKSNIISNLDIQSKELQQLNDYTRVGVIRSNSSLKDKDMPLGQAITAANNLIKEVKNSEIPMILGQVGEEFIAAITYMAANKGVQVTNQLIDDLTKQGKTKQQTTLSGFSAYVDLDELANSMGTSDKGTHYWTRQNNAIVSTNGSQGTVDITVSLSPESKLAQDLGLTDFNASIKNYNSIDSPSHPGVNILSGAPLLSIFMLLNEDFINHYLNLMSVIGPPNVRDTAEADRATGVIKHAAAVRALAGIRSTTYNSAVSDCFVVNNKSEKRVYVISTTQLLRYIRSDFDKYLLFKEPLPRRFKNDWVGGFSKPDSASAVKRITNLLKEVHKYKIYLSLSPSAIRDASNNNSHFL